MEIWLVVFLGPLLLFAVGVALVKGIHFLFSSNGVLRLISWRGFDLIAVVFLGVLCLILVAGLVALWLAAPVAAIVVGIFLLAGAVRMWTLWHRRWEDDALYDDERGRLPPTRF